MFWECSALKEVTMHRFNFDKVKEFMYLFDGCLSLRAIRLSQFNAFNFKHSKINLNLPYSIQIFEDGII